MPPKNKECCETCKGLDELRERLSYWLNKLHMHQPHPAETKDIHSGCHHLVCEKCGRDIFKAGEIYTAGYVYCDCNKKDSHPVEAHTPFTAKCSDCGMEWNKNCGKETKPAEKCEHDPCYCSPRLRPNGKFCHNCDKELTSEDFSSAPQEKETINHVKVCNAIACGSVEINNCDFQPPTKCKHYLHPQSSHPPGGKCLECKEYHDEKACEEVTKEEKEYTERIIAEEEAEHISDCEDVILKERQRILDRLPKERKIENIVMGSIDITNDGFNDCLSEVRKIINSK